MEGSKIKFALNKCKVVLIIVLVLWLLLSIVLIMPISIATIDARVEDKIDMDKFVESISNNIGNPFGNIGKALSGPYIGAFLKGDLYLILALLFFGAVGIVKTLPKNEYSNIEHGSSDWATGEKYMTLSKNKGILLAEKHYLPVDKRGNVNVLVVGRIRFW